MGDRSHSCSEDQAREGQGRAQEAHQRLLLLPEVAAGEHQEGEPEAQQQGTSGSKDRGRGGVENVGGMANHGRAQSRALR